MAAAENPLVSIDVTAAPLDTRGIVLEHAANELVFAVVGHVGCGTSEVAKTLRDSLLDSALQGGPFEVHIVKARQVIQEWAIEQDKNVPNNDDRSLAATQQFQNLGDDMRAVITKAGDHDLSSVARRLALKIREVRAQSQGGSVAVNEAVLPNGKRRAYILDSLRHPAEVELLRHVYQHAFVLVGVVCEEKKRIERLRKKYPDAGETSLSGFMKRDAKAGKPYGQLVSDTFHLSDYFVDNSTDRVLEHGVANEDWDTNEKLARLIKIVTHSEIVRPEMPETAMHHAYGAMMQSACLSRQVGAALVDKAGNVIATGTNEVPKGGGGVYGESFEANAPDDRCGLRHPDGRRFCSNTRQQNQIIENLLDSIPELQGLPAERKKELKSEMRKGRIGELIEFSRAVHAEMDALLSAAREGISLIGTRLFVTTFPCHYCARHLVTSGVDEVQFVEPYLKSQALELHDDAIQITMKDPDTGQLWSPPSAGGRKVLFRPFSGVAPRLFARAFLKDRELKDKESGSMKIASPKWGTPWHLRRASYVELEAALTRIES
jgi:deoxycytidylate deaminase